MHVVQQVFTCVCLATSVLKYVGMYVCVCMRVHGVRCVLAE